MTVPVPHLGSPSGSISEGGWDSLAEAAAGIDSETHEAMITDQVISFRFPCM